MLGGSERLLQVALVRRQEQFLAGHTSLHREQLRFSGQQGWRWLADRLAYLLPAQPMAACLACADLMGTLCSP